MLLETETVVREYKKLSRVHGGNTVEVEILAILGEARERLAEERRRWELLLWLSPSIYNVESTYQHIYSILKGSNLKIERKG